MLPKNYFPSDYLQDNGIYLRSKIEQFVTPKAKLGMIGISIAVLGSLIFLTLNTQDDSLIVGETQNSEIQSNEALDEKIKSFQTGNKKADKILSSCGSDEQCIVELLGNLAETESQESVILTLNDVSSAYNELGYYCHGIAHHLGMFLYGLNGNITQTLEFAEKRDCGGALYHGAIESYFLTELILNNAEPDKIEFVSICANFADDSEMMNQGECAHGSGHGLAKIYNYDVFFSVKRCDEFSEDNMKRLCYEGVFMENVVAYQKTGRGAINPDDILYPCNDLDQKYSGACYYYQTSHLLQKKGLEGTLDVCNNLSKMDLFFCYMGIGRQTAAVNLDDFQKIIPVCLKGVSEYQRFCYQGALILISDQKGIDESFEACKTFPDLFKMDCYTLVGAWIQIETPAKEVIESRCSMAENQQYRQVCENPQI